MVIKTSGLGTFIYTQVKQVTTKWMLFFIYKDPSGFYNDYVKDLGNLPSKSLKLGLRLRLFRFLLTASVGFVSFILMVKLFFKV